MIGGCWFSNSEGRGGRGGGTGGANADGGGGGKGVFVESNDLLFARVGGWTYRFPTEWEGWWRDEGCWGGNGFW